MDLHFWIEEKLPQIAVPKMLVSLFNEVMLRLKPLKDTLDRSEGRRREMSEREDSERKAEGADRRREDDAIFVSLSMDQKAPQW